MFGRNVHHITHMLVHKCRPSGFSSVTVHPLIENVRNNLISGKKKEKKIPQSNTLSLNIEVDAL